MKSTESTGKEILISVRDAAKLCGIGETTVRRMIDAGEFPIVRLPGVRRHLVPAKGLQAWIESRTILPE
jgi:excisionase family DNA binding protein